MTQANPHIREILCNKRRYLPLLLLGDEQESMIDRYLDRGRLFVMENLGETVAVCVVTDEGEGICELKNLAVAIPFQRQGYGRRMIAHIEQLYAPRYHTLLVGTGETPSTLGFYRQCGFTDSHRLPDFFTKHYDHPIIEEGIRLRDMVYLKKRLATTGKEEKDTMVIA